MKKISFLILGVLTILIACNPYKSLPSLDTATDWKVKTLPEHPQLEGGDSEKGLAYMLSGDYVGTGLPYDLFKKRAQKILKKISLENNISEDVPYLMSVFESENGAEVITGNCFTCHGGQLKKGEVFLGVGTTASDYRMNMTSFNKMSKTIVKLKYGKDSKEWEAYDQFSNFFDAVAPNIETHQVGPNPAARIAEACMMHRDPVDLTYIETPLYETYDYNLGCDVPPLWHVKKKNALYCTGVGQGDFTKLLMQASVLGIPDSAYAREVQKNFVDVLAWLEELEPPKYPHPIDAALAMAGKEVFEENCSKCHGTYGKNEFYPNKIVSLDVVKTDPFYATYAVKSGITEWYNKSWFATSYPQSQLNPNKGYVAQPLDGIWATAPYLHNGSVPTLEDLLNSKQRPTYWKRDFMYYDFDPEKVGWNYEEKDNGTGKFTFDTTIDGYSNTGHYFGDKLNTRERKAVIEYLKTL